MTNPESPSSHLSRREFIAGAASLTAASAFPSTAFSFSESSDPVSPAWKDEGVLDLTRSPHAKLRNVPVRAVTIKDGFWNRRRRTNVERSIPTMHDLLESHGRMDNFRRMVGKSNAEQLGPVYSDSDIYKWIEAAGFAMQSGDLAPMRPAIDHMIDEIVAVQEKGGYLNTYYFGDRRNLAMLPQTQTGGHELYNIGHMLQSAIAFYRATGDRRLLDAGSRFVDDFLLPNYGPAPKNPIVSGHPEIEMALIELYRIDGDRRKLDLAGYILQGDDRISLPAHRTIYMFSGTPFTRRTRLEGHAVRAMYACCGATDYYMETGDDSYWHTLSALWEDLSRHKLYISGGVGARSDGEAFGDNYELPNAQAYGESCAAIGNMMWNWRMLAVTGEARFADIIERALYNGINSGMSLDGTLYCYRNPLAFDPSTGEKIRNAWYDTTCCPPNLERTLASLPGYFYSTSKNGLYVHLYDNSDLDWHLEDGTALRVTQKTNYPWSGDVSLNITPSHDVDFVLYLRIPGWTDSASVSVNGKSVSGVQRGQYLPIRRRWAPGDVVQLRMEMPVQVVESNYHVIENNGRIAVERGPLLFCMEQLDQPAGIDLDNLAVALGRNPSTQFESEFRSDILDGVMLLRHTGVSLERPSSGVPLYSRYSTERVSTKRTALTFIPYYAWANRTPAPMQVWTPLLRT